MSIQGFVHLFIKFFLIELDVFTYFEYPSFVTHTLHFFLPICQWAFVPCGSAYQHLTLPLLKTALVSEVLLLGKAVEQFAQDK